MLSWILRRRRREPDLLICPSCGGDVVVPVDHLAVDGEHWWMRLRCGACGAGREMTVTNEDAQRYDRDLARGMAAIERTVKRLDRDSAKRELRTLISAFRHDLIDASDFARGVPSGSIGAQRRTT